MKIGHLIFLTHPADLGHMTEVIPDAPEHTLVYLGKVGC